MHLQTAISCVHYDDFLSLTLPHNLSLLPSITVLTSPRDRATIDICKRLQVPLLISDAWHTGGTLNKAAALNQWVTHAAAYDPDAWLMTLDADVLLTRPIEPYLPHLDPRCLYSAPRRMCEELFHFDEFRGGKRPLPTFRLDRVPVLDGKLWGTVTASNPIGLAGYLQLWHPAHAFGAKRFEATGTAEGYDLLFGLSFPDDARRLLNQEVLHIGPTQVNWAGRRSARWVAG